MPSKKLDINFEFAIMRHDEAVTPFNRLETTMRDAERVTAYASTFPSLKLPP
jgi:hypothetical protein